MTAEAAALGMTLDQWRQMRAADGGRRWRSQLDLAAAAAEDRRFRLAHPAAMYSRDAVGIMRHVVDAAQEDFLRALERQLLYGDAP